MSDLGLLMGKFHKFLTVLSARQTIVAGIIVSHFYLNQAVLRRGIQTKYVYLQRHYILWGLTRFVFCYAMFFDQIKQLV